MTGAAVVPGAPVDVTVVIAARDEAAEIADCVRSVSWAREVLVVEHGSTDDTAARAAAAGATVLTHPFTTIGAQRNAALACATCRWALVLDADERATPALAAAVARAIAQAPAGGAGYRVPRRNIFLGREIRHGGWERDRPLRLFPSAWRYDARPVHEHVLAQGPVGALGEALWHTPYASLDEYFDKLARYARDWAAQHHAGGRRAGVGDLLLRPPARLLTMLVLRGGWRDGGHGLLLAVLASVSVAAKYAHLWALGRGRPGTR